MPEYIAKEGDTFESLARRFYGDDAKVPVIVAANPGTAEPTPGVPLFIPVGTTIPVTLSTSDPDEVVLSLGGKRYRFWESVTISKALDGIASLEFTSPFEPESPQHRELFRPFSYAPIELAIGGELIFRGTMAAVRPTSTPSRSEVTVAAYALPGVLMDCTMPSSMFPLEFDNVTLDVIAKKLADAFSIIVDFQADPGPVFERVALRPEQAVFGFLAELAKQVDIVISSGPDGSLVFRQPITDGIPVAKLSEGSAPLLNVISRFNEQNYFSHITGIDPTVVGSEGSQFTVKNTKLPDAIRPHTFLVRDADGPAVQSAVEAKVSRMFGSSVTYTASVVGWRDGNGELWIEDKILELSAPGAMIYDSTKLLIKNVSFSATPTKRIAVLTLVLPGSLSGKIPETLPWEQ